MCVCVYMYVYMYVYVYICIHMVTRRNLLVSGRTCTHKHTHTHTHKCIHFYSKDGREGEKIFTFTNDKK